MHDVVVATVDSSQGCEADIVIVSFVRSKGGDRSSTVGFLSDDRRLNVALTRGRNSAVVAFFKSGPLNHCIPHVTLIDLVSLSFQSNS